ncbi:GPI mannosyltransferase 3 isoform X2 [Punica granatum]|uniref:Mannosyltransferase n=1 Tax=Punica granatum TaxID=22663 RepID=A0A6P8DIU3_PUNGR|nr:GPI mannosyltransferase 3 isoform X2 [Punica granatum]
MSLLPRFFLSRPNSRENPDVPPLAITSRRRHLGISVSTDHCQHRPSVRQATRAMRRQRINVPSPDPDRDKSQNPPHSTEKRPKPQDSHSFHSERNVFLLCLAMRAVNSLLVQTYFNPDEHWQALEVAHKIAFGYGHLTWEWKEGIRSYLHPMVFALLYKVLALLGLDKPWLMVKAPRLLQSFFCAIGDLYLHKLSHVLFGYCVARWALFSELLNWFMFFCFPRTLSNSLETVLTLVGLYYWPCLRASSSRDPAVSRSWGLFVAALACAIRPTSAIIWAYIGLLELWFTSDRMKFIFLETIPIGALVLGFTFLLDRLVYGSWVFVPLNFLKFNFLSSGGDYYGTHVWHWYFSQGFTVMLFTFLPFSLAGIAMAKHWRLSGLIGWVLGLYSVLGHKEFRFVLPVLPVALIFSGVYLASLSNPHGLRNKKEQSSKSCMIWPAKMRWAVVFLLVTNIPMALYMSLVHQRGSEDVMNFLSREAANDRLKSILFLMPCHATPYYSALHRNIPMRFLDCSPSEERSIPDESDGFMMDPSGFASELAKNWSLPSHIVLFDSEERKLQEFLSLHSFKEIKRFFHANFKVDRDLQASVAVYALTAP